MAGDEADDQEIVTERQKEEGRIEHAHDERPEVAQLKQDVQKMAKKGGQALIGLAER